jgi:Fic family protein
MSKHTPDVNIESLCEFIRESNAIENEYSEVAFNDALLAWGYGFEIMQRNNGRLRLKDILIMHGMLMKNLWTAIAGKWRDRPVTINGRLCPMFWIVEDLMTEWVDDFGNIHHAFDNMIKRAHIRFERIHPFVDGNGRIGRIVMNLQRVYNGLPLLIIHTGKEQEKYYEWFK